MYGKNPSNSVLVLRLPVARNSPLLSPLGEENVSQERRRGDLPIQRAEEEEGQSWEALRRYLPLEKYGGTSGGGGIGRGECSVIYRRRKREEKASFSALMHETQGGGISARLCSCSKARFSPTKMQKNKTFCLMFFVQSALFAGVRRIQWHILRNP